MKIYLISGLGYDCRIFENLDFKNHKVRCLNWIGPQSNESIQVYPSRMLKHVLVDENKVLLIGHSMGGVIAQEIAVMRNIEKEKPLGFSQTNYYEMINHFKNQFKTDKENQILT